MTHNKKTYQKIYSPDGGKHLLVGVDAARTWYSLYKENGDVLIDTSYLSLYANNTDLLATFNPKFTEDTYDETWEQPWGEQRYVRNNYHELSVETDMFVMRFRLFNEGLGFRYEIKGEGDITIEREETEFNLDIESSAWWIPALGQNHYEHLFKKTPLRNIDTAHTPLTIELPSGGFAAIHEAALYDYGAMNVIPTEEGLTSLITPLKDGTAAKTKLPFKTPWRTVIFADRAIDLGVSRIMLNLNEPSKIEDTSWIRPVKFMGIWWAMFIEYFTWASGDKHGATTANAMRYINAAKKFNIPALLIEGWNETWDGDWTKNGDKMDHMRPYPDFDIKVVTDYAKSQGVEIVGHHETSGNISHYEWQLPEAYDYYRVLGVKYIKTGYVAPKLNTGDFHSSQVGINHYQKTVELTAEREIMLNIHEPTKGTGIERTWPNLLTREAVMGQEYEGGAVTPEHATVLPFTRSLAGPFDYTPGLFNLSGTDRKVSSTLAKQLAFYVTMFSPMQMVADLPEHYENQPAFEFLREVPVNWDQTVPIDGVIGDYYVAARKDRGSDNWYVGGVTDENDRTITVPLDFLPQHRAFEATIYRDTEDAHWQHNPEAHTIEQIRVTSNSSLTVRMAPGGGFAISIRPEGENLSPYPEIH